MFCNSWQDLIINQLKNTAMIERSAPQITMDEVFFPVIEEPVYMEVSKGKMKKVSGYKAIVKRDTGSVFSVVSDNYRLIDNREAYEMADFVVRELFEGKRLDDFSIFNVLMPKTQSSCRLDLILPNNFNTLFGLESESYTPFVRISNSYNRTLVLSYEIGFCRWICKNGCIFGQKGIRFSMDHTKSRREIARVVRAQIERIGDVALIWSSFEKKMETLRRINIPSSYALPLFCKVFNIKVQEMTMRQLDNAPYPMPLDDFDDLDDLKRPDSELKILGMARKTKQIEDSARSYFDSLGNNAYAMMNVLTDYASFPKWTTSPSNYVHGYQRKVGQWIDNFVMESASRNFSLRDYIGEDNFTYAERLRTILSKMDVKLVG